MMDTLGNHYIENIRLGNLDRIASEVKKKIPIETDIVTPPKPETTVEKDNKDTKEPRSASPQGKLVLLWAKIKQKQ